MKREIFYGWVVLAGAFAIITVSYDPATSIPATGSVRGPAV